jgi:hypothetical protein
MVVCPSCRNINPEDSTVCARCGTTLAPGHMALLPVRRTESERPPIEVRKPPQPSKWRPFVMVGILAVVVGGAGVMWLLRPDPCSGTNFRSENFGYCVLVPEGWEAGPARFGAEVTLDQFAPPTESATVVVEAVDLEGGTALDEWSAFVRLRVEEAGLIPGAPSETTLDGVGALQWDVTVTPVEGESFRMREVVTVRDDIGWRITLNDVSDGFGTSAVVFRDMLDSWQFR